MPDPMPESPCSPLLVMLQTEVAKIDFDVAYDAYPLLRPLSKGSDPFPQVPGGTHHIRLHLPVYLYLQGHRGVGEKGSGRAVCRA